MEKKGNRSVQGSSKGLANDLAKKSQDASNGKQWPRGSRRREPATTISVSKSEPTSRKPTPQRNRTIVDKRPKPRGVNYNNGGVAAATNTTTDYAAGGLTEPDIVELGSVFVHGSKKENINSMCGFSYSREIRSHGERAGHRVLGPHRQRYNKEQFLQANCQFLVNACGDYKQYMNNPDALVSWDLIEQVNVQVSEYPSCPICLYPPIAAKMTRCGHIYCWACILQYLALSDKTWCKCPICYEAIYKQDLKSVVSFLHPPLTVNDTITFKLMKRLRGSLIAYPSDHKISTEEENALYNMSQIESRGIYSKLVVANRAQVLAIIERESAELQAQFVDEEYPKKCFIEQAITLLKDRESFVMMKESDGDVIEGLDTLSLDEVVEDLDVLQVQASPAQQPAKYFYFYQASDGQHIYLHPVNVEMLVHMHGALEYCPNVIVGKIVEKEGNSMTEELRKKCRYLQHLPLTCQYEVAEIHLKPPLVSRETLEQFKEKLDTRRKRRQQKARDEKRREKRIAEEENKKYLGRFPTPNIHIESHQDFPQFKQSTPEGAAAASSCYHPQQQRTDSESTPRSMSPVSSSSNVGSLNDNGGMSFAKMLSSSKPRAANPWPQLKTITQEPHNLISVTGAKVATTFTLRARNQSESECELDCDMPIPTPRQTVGDVIAMALEKVAPANDGQVEGDGGSGKKKKKKKQKVLLASSMVRPRD